MLTLSGKIIRSSRDDGVDRPLREIYSLTTDADLPMVLRKQKAFLCTKQQKLPAGYKHYIFVGDFPAELPAGAQSTVLPASFDYLGEGDVVAITGSSARSLFRANSTHNSILLTERCNHYCLMCSQPPKRSDDSWLLDEAFRTVELIPRSTQSIGITGGEPTLYGDRFIDLVRHIKSWLPHTSLHILSNGRAFADIGFSRDYAAIKHSDVMVGIPIYSCDPSRHDYIVQSRGAFDETIRGVLNLKKLGQRVEIRVVIHKQSYEGLPALAEFISRNLLFVDQVALMGLEMTGFTLANLDELWIDPKSYAEELSSAVETLDAYRIPVSIYNHQLCLLPESLEKFNVKSISDWKNEFARECDCCVRRHECGGFFSSGIANRYSPSIKPFV